MQFFFKTLSNILMRKKGIKHPLSQKIRSFSSISKYFFAASFIIIGVMMLFFSSCNYRNSVDYASNHDLPAQFYEDPQQQIATTQNYTLSFEKKHVEIYTNHQGERWEMQFENANNKPLKSFEEKEKTIWYKNIYDHTHLKFYERNRGQIAYDFVLEPGANSQDICMDLEGNQTAYIDALGELVLPIKDGAIHHSKPYTYQMIEGKKIPIKSRFLLEGTCLGFELGIYNEAYAVVIDPLIYFTSLADCCTENRLGDASFEAPFTEDENFPNSTLTPSDNSNTGDLGEWTYDDGGSNTSQQVLIDDPTRASEGDHFLYIPIPPVSSSFNYCVGNLVSSTTSAGCPEDTYHEGLRYVLKMDYVPFDRNNPNGSVGGSFPAAEYLGPTFTEIDLYDEDGNLLNSNETAVAWTDVGTSWKTAYGLSSAAIFDINAANPLINVWFSVSNAATTGILIDNTYLSALRMSDAGESNVDCGDSNNQITFTLNPVSNLGEVPNIKYDVDVPSGYSISPIQGTYGEETTFTLTINSGDFTSGTPANIDVDLTDEINIDCFVTASITNPYPCSSLNLPWAAGSCGGNDIIVAPGIAAATCGVSTGVTGSEQYSFGLIDINGAIPTSTRENVSGLQDMYHHSSWHIDQIGNVYGITINTKTGDILVTASANYGMGFWDSDGILKYGSLGGANDVEAAGAVYKIDGTTGQASLFSQLPQQSSDITHINCETQETTSRTGVGVGLGNIAYDGAHDQFFVSNIEDGRIYRLDINGVILDSYDPLNYATSSAGIENINDLVYGLAIEPLSNRLFFGTVDAPGGAPAPSGSPTIYSIQLTTSGGFTGTIDNSYLPTGIITDNYVDADVFHTNISTGGGFSFTNNTTYFISDLAFTPDDKLLVGVRVGCNNSFFTSYNHFGETSIVSRNTDGKYNQNITEFDISVTGEAGIEDGYGGVSYYELSDGSVQYVVSSADIIEEIGPHGIAVFHSSPTGTPITPLGGISYGEVDTGDPKGVGGEVEVFSDCYSAPPCTLTASANDANICIGEDAILTVVSDGFVYLWSTGETTSSIATTPTTNTTYTVTVSYGGTCSTTAEANVTVSPQIFDNITATDAITYNGNEGTASVSPTGGTPGYTYLWSTGSTSSNIGSLTADTYSVTVSDANNCTTIASVEVANPSCNVSADAGSNQSICEGDNASLTASGGVSYLWSTGETNPTISVSPSVISIYTVTVTDAVNCPSTATVQVSITPLPDINSNSFEVCEEESVPLNITTSNGTPPYTFLWDAGGINPFGGSSTSSDENPTFDATGITFGEYAIALTIMDSSIPACEVVETLTVTVNDLPEVAPSSPEVCEEESMTLTANPSNGTSPYTYSWDAGAISPFGGNSTSSDENPTFDATGIAFGDYNITLTVTDSSVPACEVTETLTVTVNDLPEAAPSSPEVCEEESMTLTANPSNGTPPYTYSWDAGAISPFGGNSTSSDENPTFNATGITFGDYVITLTVTDSSVPACEVTETLTVTVNDLPEAAPSSPEVCEEESMTLTANPSNGTSPYTYSWDAGAISPFGGNSTSNDENPTFDATGITFGDYVITLIVTDSSVPACEVTETLTVTINDLPEAAPSSPEVCEEESMTLTANPSNGTSPYTYSWDAGAISPFGGNSTSNDENPTFDATGITFGDYVITLIVTDSSVPACEVTETLTVTVNDLPEAAPSSPEVCEEESMTLTANPSNGTPPYTFSWDAGAISPFGGNSTSSDENPTFDATGVAFGDYNITLTVTDSSVPACEVTETLTVTVNDLPEAAPSSPEVCEEESMTLTANPSNGTPPYTYSWDAGTISPFGGNSTSSDENPTFDATGITFGDYVITLIVTDSSVPACEVTETLTVTVNDLPEVAPSSPEVCEEESMTLTANPSNGTPPYTFSWDAGAISPFGGNSTSSDENPIFDATGIVFGDYNITLTITDSSNPTCEMTETLTVTINDLPEAAPSSPEVCEEESMNLAANPSFGTPPYNFHWDAGAIHPFTGDSNTSTDENPTFDATGIVFGDYVITLIVTDSSVPACEVTETLTVTVNDLPEAVPSSPEVCEEESMTLTSNPSLGTPPYSFHWNAGAINPFGGNSNTSTDENPTFDATGITFGDYAITLTIIDSSIPACEVVETLTVTVNDLPEVAPSSPEVCEEESMTLTANPSNGTPPYTFSWDAGAISPFGGNSTSSDENPIFDATGIVFGDYNITLTITDSSNPACEMTETLTVTVNDLPEAAPNSSEVCEKGMVMLEANASAGSPDYTYLWDAGTMTPFGGNSTSTEANPIFNAAGLIAGTYSFDVTIGDSANPSCEITETVTVIVHELPNIAPTVPAVCEEESITLSANPSNGVPPYTFSWDAGAISPFGGESTSTDENPTFNAANIPAGDYTISLTVTDNNSHACSFTENLIITVNDLPVANSANIEHCEETLGSMIAIFDLTTVSDEVNNGTGYTVAYYEDNAAAMPITNPTSYQSTTATVYALVTDTQTPACSEMTAVNLTVYALPEVFEQTIEICEDDLNSATATSQNLQLLESTITSTLNPTVVWYSDASMTSLVANPSNVTVTDGMVFYAWVTNGHACSQAVELTYQVNNLPTATSLNVDVCEDTNDSGIATGIDLTELNDDMNPDADASIVWYEDAALSILVANPTNVSATNGTIYYALLDNGKCIKEYIFTYNVVPLASIGDIVWYDDNKDGIQDDGEEGVDGVTVKLFNGEDVLVATTQTANEGLYLFDNLKPGDYYLKFELPTDYEPSPQDANSNVDDAMDSDANPVTGQTSVTVLDPGEDDMTWDAGISLIPASIGDCVWYDEDKDGVQDDGEAGVNGVTVTLYNAANEEIASTITAFDPTSGLEGKYFFEELVPDDYYVAFDLPEGHEYSPQDANSNTDDAKDSDADSTTGETVLTTLDPGENDPTWDAGISLIPASIGDCVWYDEDKDGVQDDGEAGVNGVTVTLYNASNEEIASTITAFDSTSGLEGKYFFEELVPGDYYVVFDLPEDYEYSPQDANSNTDDAKDSDADSTTGETVLTTLDPGENDPTWDAGISLIPASIGDCVWYDEDKDGVQDDGEAGVSGVTVTLYNTANEEIASTITAFDSTSGLEGKYFFEELVPGDYYVAFDLPEGHEYSPQDANSNTDDAKDSDVNSATGQTVVTTLDPGENDPTWDAGISLIPASIGDCVWLDENNNGIQDDGETGVNGVTVTLYNATGEEVASTETATHPTNGHEGYYSFEELVPGDYYVVFELPEDYKYAPQDANSNENDALDSDANPETGTTAITTLSPGENDSTWDAGINPAYACLGNFVWLDENQNGLQDLETESGVNGVLVQLMNENFEVLASIETANHPENGNAGYYKFSELDAADYFLIFHLPEGYEWTKRDVLQQGIIDETDSDVDTSTDAAWTERITLEAGETDLTWDAGIYPSSETLASIGDCVWLDSNENGIQDAGEEGINGIEVSLLDEAGNEIESTITNTDPTTGANGKYFFEELTPAVYSLQFKIPEEYTISSRSSINSTPENDSNIDEEGKTTPTELIGGEEDWTWDAGIYLSATENLASIGDCVWLDSNENGIQDAGEEGINGIEVSLLDEAGNEIESMITSTDPTTGANGKYVFEELPPAIYSLQFKIPEAYAISSRSSVGSTDENDSNIDEEGKTPPTELIGGEEDWTWDAGIYLPTASIGDCVWLDSNENGIQDAGEQGVNGIEVSLLDEAGNVLAVTITDTDPETGLSGKYLFEELPPAVYSLQFKIPEAYAISSRSSVGSTDENDSNIDEEGKTVPTELIGGEEDWTWDAGIYLPTASIGDCVWLDSNENGIQDAVEQGINGIEVSLLGEAGNVLAVTITDTDPETGLSGKYAFEELPPAIYSLQFKIPEAYAISSRSSVGSTDENDSNIDEEGKTAPTELTGGEEDWTWDAGIYLPTAEELASIGDCVWHDLNRDGIQDEEESGINGVLVILYDAEGNILRTVETTENVETGKSGYYLFTGLEAGAYYIGVESPIGESGELMTSSYAHNTPDDTHDSDINPETARSRVVVLSEGEHNPTIDAGFYETCTIDIVDPIITVCFFDEELGLLASDIEIAVEWLGAQVGQTMEIVVGNQVQTYTVDAPAGILPFQFTVTEADNLDNLSASFITEGGCLEDINFSFPAMCKETGSIGDFVWIDENKDGIQNVGEYGVNGVTIHLLNAQGEIIATTITTNHPETGEEGYYLFTNVAPGAYTLVFEVPEGYGITASNQIDNEGVDSDIHVESATASIIVQPGEHSIAWDAGLLCLGNSLESFVWMDVNGNQSIDSGEQGVSGIVLTVVDADGEVVAETISGEDGSFRFNCLPEGSYILNASTTEENDFLLPTTLVSIGFDIDNTEPTRNTEFGFQHPDCSFVADDNIQCNLPSNNYFVIVSLGGGTAPYQVTGSHEAIVEQDVFEFGPLPISAMYDIEVTDANGCSVRLVSNGSPCEATLPVELIDFSGEVQKAGNFLTWITASEWNSAYYRLERSIDGHSFVEIAVIDATGTTSVTSYTYLDRTAPLGTAYYRLMQIDVDGAENDLGVLSLERGEGKLQILSAWPNPTQDWINVSYQTQTEGIAYIRIFDISGRLVGTFEEQVNSGINHYLRMNVHDLANGMYWINVIKNNQTISKSFIKQ